MTEAEEKWKMPTITPEQNPNGVLETSQFATLFPQYREKYIKEIFPILKKFLQKFFIEIDLNLIEGSLTVSTTPKMWDPYAIIKARDLIKLLSRSVPYSQAIRVMEDNIFCDIIKIRGYVRNKEKFIKRRQRLLGPNGMTLKALEIVTECYILVQGHTVSIVGPFKGIKKARRVIEDCMKNVHPVYHIKELMIKRELEKDPELKSQDWSRFLPNFKKRNVQTKKVQIKKKKEYTPFPPEQLPRKEDILMETGEYFLTQNNEKKKSKEEKNEKNVKSQKNKQKNNVKSSKKDSGKESQRKKQKQEENISQQQNEEVVAKKRKAEIVEPTLEELKEKLKSHKKRKLEQID